MESINMRTNKNTIELEPTLKSCIETQARKEYNRTAAEILGNGNEKKLAKKLEALRIFLETADFRNLRRESEKHLNEGERVIFKLYIDQQAPAYEMEVTGGNLHEEAQDGRCL